MRGVMFAGPVVLARQASLHHRLISVLPPGASRRAQKMQGIMENMPVAKHGFKMCPRAPCTEDPAARWRGARGAVAMPGSSNLVVQLKPSAAQLQAQPFCSATATDLPQSPLKTRASVTLANAESGGGNETFAQRVSTKCMATFFSSHLWQRICYHFRFLID